MRASATMTAGWSTSVDGGHLCGAMRWFATGVAVVGTVDATQPYAAVVNSVTSVSLDPPLVLVCLQVGSRTCDAIERQGRFAISVLAEDHESACRRLVKEHPDLDDPAVELVDGLPLVRGALAEMACTVESTQTKGDHVIVVGHVTATRSAPRDPLLFYGSAFHSLGVRTRRSEPAAARDVIYGWA